MAKLRFTPWVADDLREAIAWYESRSPVAAQRLRAAIRAAFRDIEQSPLAYACAVPEFEMRFRRVRGFPLLVLYDVVDASVLVISVRHEATDPDSWRRRRSPQGP